MKNTVIALLMMFSLEVVASPPALPAEVMNSMKGPVGRYQMVRLDKEDPGGAAVMILDTANGDLWQWISTPGAKNDSEVKVRLIYMGTVRPGTRMGEVIDKGGHSPR